MLWHGVLLILLSSQLLACMASGGMCVRMWQRMGMSNRKVTVGKSEMCVLRGGGGSGVMNRTWYLDNE